MTASIESDFLIVGSGIAGLSLAIKLARQGVVCVVSKKEFLDGSTAHAQGGIAAVMSPEDSFERHIQDTLAAGAGLCREEIVRGVVQEGPDRVRELIDWGMAFSRDERDEDHPYELGLEGGHSRRRVLHARDSTGAEVARTLLRKAQSLANVRFFDYHIAIDLITSEKLGMAPPNRCLGAYVLDRKKQQVRTFIGRRATLLATGGAGKVYLYTSNPDVATGDGIAMACRAGAKLANLEFVQFHPTCLYHPNAKSFLISEAVRGEGAVLRLRDGTPFMQTYHPSKELAPRDVVARAIDLELKKRGDPFVYLDIRSKGGDFVRKRFPMIYEQCLRFGVDMAKDLIPVVPAEHYFCGGVLSDAQGRSSIDGLWAIGEVACTGLHGANRLASNSLLEGLVFAHRAAEALANEPRTDGRQGDKETKRHGSSFHPVTASPRRAFAVPPWNPGNARNSDEQVVITQNWDEIRQLMWNYVGIVRSDKRLERAYRRIQLLQQEIHEYYWNFIVTSDLIELRNIATVAELVVRCAMTRTESRGLHFNLDHPERDDARQRHDTIIQREQALEAQGV
ncbi:MAG TPA: L-aspartate oxidase [Elusimicrobiota bacterium]|nr:L-aspartate oxidase [Elusimicrobiota bacterium]